MGSLRRSETSQGRSSGCRSANIVALLVAVLAIASQRAGAFQPAAPLTVFSTIDAPPGFPPGSVVSGLSAQSISRNGWWLTMRSNVQTPGGGSQNVLWAAQNQFTSSPGPRDVFPILRSADTLLNAPAGFTVWNILQSTIADSGITYATVTLHTADHSQSIDGIAVIFPPDSTGQTEKRLLAYTGQLAPGLNPSGVFTDIDLTYLRSNGVQALFQASAGTRSGLWLAFPLYVLKVVATGDSYPDIGTVTGIANSSTSLLSNGAVVARCGINGSYPVSGRVLVWPDGPFGGGNAESVVDVGPGLGFTHFVGDRTPGAALDLDGDIRVVVGINAAAGATPSQFYEFGLGGAGTPIEPSDFANYCCNFACALSPTRVAAFWHQPTGEGQLYWGSVASGSVHVILDLHDHNILSGAPGFRLSPRQVYPVSYYALNTFGRLAIDAYLQPPTGGDIRTLLIQGAGESLWPVTLPGNTIEVRPGQNKVVSQVVPTSYEVSGGADGRTRWWTDGGTALYVAYFTDGSHAVMLSSTCIAPPQLSASDQPASVTALLGGDARLSVNYVSGFSGTSYWWRHWTRLVNGQFGWLYLEDNARLSGAHGRMLTIHAFEPGDLGDYSCEIGNGCGRVVTQNATLSSAPPCQPRKLLSIGAEYDNIGRAVAIEQGFAVVGAPMSVLQTHQGSARIYACTSDGWIPAPGPALIDPSGAAGDSAGSSVSISGGTIVMGAPGDDLGANADQGSATVWVQSGSTWVMEGRLVASDGAALDAFGSAVSVSGDTIVVGAPGKSVGANAGQGAAYVFKRVNSQWQQQLRLVATDGAANDHLGSSVAIDGTTIVAGAWQAGPLLQQGAAWVFERSVLGWTQAARLVGSDTVASDWFGYSVAIRGDTIVAGAPHVVVSGRGNQGAAYLFSRTGVTWTQASKLLALDGASGDLFGFSVSASAGRIVVGAPVATANGHPGQGAAYVYERESDLWTQRARLTSHDGANFDYLGDAVAISGDSILAGAPAAEISGREGEGASYVFANSNGLWLGESPPIITAQPVSVTTCSPVSADFAVSAVGNTPMTYSWRFESPPASGNYNILSEGVNSDFNSSMYLSASGVDSRTLQVSNVLLGNHPGEIRFEVLVLNEYGYAFSEPALLTILPSCCTADFNGMGGLSVQDIFDFLNGWFASDPRADFNGVNGIEVQDIFDFLNAWLAGCP